MYQLLQGLTVVEGSAFVAGPTCGLYLAQLGAEVIRFDQLGGGPDFNRWPLGPEGSFYWEGLNKAKKSVALDLARPEGRALAARLAAASGLFVTNFPAEGFLAHERLAAIRPDLITVRVMGWPDAAPAVDYTVNAAVGLPLMTGLADDARPVNHVLPAWDLLTGAYAAFALVSAHLARLTDGKGREVRIPLSDVAAATVANLGLLAEASLTGDRPRMGNDLFGAFGRDFATRDGTRIMLVAITPRQWRSLVRLLAIETHVAALEAELGVAFAEDEGLRFAHRDRLFPLFEAAFAARDLAELEPAFAAENVCWGPYQPLSAAARDPRLVTANPIFTTLDHPSGARYPAPGPALSLAGEPRAPTPPAPRLGEHTEAVLAGLLRLTPAEIGRLRQEGIVA